MTKLTITQIFAPKTFGDFISQSVFTKEYPNTYIGGDASVSKDWKVGDVVEVVVTEKEKNGKVYKNFSLPKKADVAVSMATDANERIMRLESRVTTLELSFERKFEELTSRIKSDVMIDTQGKFQTTADYKESQKPVPGFEPDGMPMDLYNDEPEF